MRCVVHGTDANAMCHDIPVEVLVVRESQREPERARERERKKDPCLIFA